MTFLSPPVRLVVGAAGAGMPETMDAELTPCRLAGRDCARRLRHRWRTRRADCTGLRPPGPETQVLHAGEASPAGSTYPRRQAGCAAERGQTLPSRSGPTPAGGRTAARARRASGSAYQPAYLAITGVSSTISTSSRESLLKARHMATSSQESQGPCSSPVASSTTV